MKIIYVAICSIRDRSELLLSIVGIHLDKEKMVHVYSLMPVVQGVFQ